jgi:hypothetical protein
MAMGAVLAGGLACAKRRESEQAKTPAGCRRYRLKTRRSCGHGAQQCCARTTAALDFRRVVDSSGWVICLDRESGAEPPHSILIVLG